MDAGAPGERNNQHGEPRRSLEGLDCLGMLPATPANMREACGRRGSPSSGNRRRAVTAFHEKEASRGGHATGGYSPSYKGNPGTEPTFAPIQTVFLDLESVDSMMRPTVLLDS